MNNLQWLVYLGGIVAFGIGCYFYFSSKKNDFNDKQVKVRKIFMNFFLIIALICLIYSWF